MLVQRSCRLLFLFVLSMSILAACNMPSKQSTPVPGLVNTYAAETIVAELTRSASGQQPLQTLPPSATQSPTGLPAQATATQPPSPTLPPGDTPTPTLTPTEIVCDKVEFVDDITVEDKTQFSPGESFEKIWRLKNVGSCTWTSAYSLVFDSGDALGAPASQQLTTGTVAPGQMIDIAVTLTAPDDPGTYTGYFKLRSPSSLVFGLGSKNEPFWVKIEVPELSGVLFDFLSQAKNADWGSGVEPVDYAGPGHAELSYGGSDDDADGFVKIKDAQKLENGSLSAKILLTYPRWENNGYIIGRFPEYRVGAGDHLKGRLGFIALEDGACGEADVTFEIHYTLDSDLGTRARLGQWHETCNGRLTPIDIDLSALKGKSVQFYLVVLANGAFEQDWAIWSSLGVVR